MTEIFQTIVNNTALFVISMGISLAALSIICGTIVRLARIHSTTKLRREIAAYIAEGAMTPEQGERVVKATAADEEDG
jgi:cell division protein FtsX